MTESLRERFRKPSFGAWTSGDPFTCEIMGKAGYDWIILETQHRNMSPERMVSALHALALGLTPSLVRVGGGDLIEIARALDIGADGVIVPVVNTGAQARAITDAMRYPPDGSRSYGLVRAGLGDDKTPICVLMIETVEAMSNLDEIASVPGVDVLFVGIHDLALSMGIDPATGLAPEMVDALKQVAEACNRYGVVPGCASFGFGDVERLLAIGMCFISVGADGAFVRHGAMADAKEIAKWQGRLKAEREKR
jgi:4-hydroxy-2-oxoheptanedioate aldolase